MLHNTEQILICQITFIILDRGSRHQYLRCFGLSYLYPVKPVADSNESRDKFLFPRARYYGDFTPENLAFNANLQEFAQRVATICGLETGGKISPEDAYEQIRTLWKTLKRSKAGLLDAPKPPLDEPPDNPNNLPDN